MITFKKILYITTTICVLQHIMLLVEGAIIADASNSAEGSNAKAQAATSSDLGSIYHKSRQLRCATCYEDRRYGDDRSRYYGSYSARSGDDRASAWYYPSYDRYEDRGYRGSEYDRYGSSGSDRYGGDRYASADRYGADRYGADRYGAADRYGTADRYAGYRDDHYSSRATLYDRYESRPRVPQERLPAYDRGESRGYGYDNRDRYYGSDRDYYGRDRYYERPRYGAGAATAVGSSRGYGGYDRDYYDRYSPRSQPGYYFAKPQEDRRYLPESGYSSPCGLRRPNCPYDAPEEGTRVSSGTIDSGHYNVGVSQTNYHTNSNTNQNEGSKGSASPSGWSYMREDDQPSRDDSSSGSFASKNNNNNSNNHRDRNTDQQSSGYSALLDRATNLIAVEPMKPAEGENEAQESANAGDTPKQRDNEQNS